MLSVALKILIGNKASCIGVIFGIFLATLLISQQSAIFLGLVSRSYRIVTDNPIPDIWVIDSETESDEKVRNIPLAYLDVVRSVPGVSWAVPINVASVPLSTRAGVFQISILYGVDDATLIGAPTEILEGNLRDLHRPGGVFVDVFSAKTILAKTLPDGTKVPLTVGDEFEINGHRAITVGICKITQGFFPQPILYTTNSQFSIFSSMPGDTAGFIVAKAAPNANLDTVLKQIHSHTGLAALTSDQIKWKITKYFLGTGILINFGLSVLLGLIIGFSIAGQIFYIITLENITYYALIKALGARRNTILQMIFSQAAVVGVVGFCLGTGATVLWGWAIKSTTLAFLFPWELLLFTGFVVIIICIFTAGMSVRQIFKVDPKVLMGG